MEDIRSGRPARFGAGERRSVEKETLQELLATAIGADVSCDFLIGTQSLITKQGVLSMVGNTYLLLRQREDDTYLLCDIFTLKFMTIFQPESRPDTTGTAR